MPGRNSDPDRGHQQPVFVTPDAPAANLVAVSRLRHLHPDAIQNRGPDPPFVRLLAPNADSRSRSSDAPSDHLGDFIIPGTFRQRNEHATDILAVIRYMQQRADAPISAQFSKQRDGFPVVSLAIKLPSELRIGRDLLASSTTSRNELGCS